VLRAIYLRLNVGGTVPDTTRRIAPPPAVVRSVVPTGAGIDSWAGRYGLPLRPTTYPLQALWWTVTPDVFGRRYLPRGLFPS